jgi:hypothetical protein
MAIIVLVLSACSALTQVEQPTITPTDVIMADCWHSFQVAAWQDLNEDGLWGVDEPPLEGVKFNPGGPIMEVETSLFSKADGRLNISVYHPGPCYRETYTITAVPPESYTPTTPVYVIFILNQNGLVFKAQFGFRPVSKK